MPREITDRNRVVEAVKNLNITAELFEEQNGKPKFGGDLEVIVQGRDYGNGKRVGPYVRLLSYDPREEIMREGDWGGNTFYISVDGTLEVSVRDADGNQRKISQIDPGACFGEMAVLAGIERNATVSVLGDTPATVLEVTRPALRLLRKLPKFGHLLDDTYRAHGFARVLDDLTATVDRPLSQKLIEHLKARARYMVYGKHHVLCKEGAAIERLFLVKNGWVRRTRGLRFPATSPEVVRGMGGDIGVDFLGAGNCLGLEALGKAASWSFDASLMARTELLEIPLADLNAEPDLLKELASIFSGFSSADDSIPKTVREVVDLSALEAAEQEIATGIVDGANLLVMDMDLCVRCGNCSLACHKIHGQSRLVRRGIQIARPVVLKRRRLQHALIPQVCMHCKDPECLTGCPTGSIFRDPLGQVDIDPKTCIGCFDCATQCPYDAISMVPRDSAKPEPNVITKLFSLKSAPVEEATEAADDVVAIKCNLCEKTTLNPSGVKRQAYSCEENCPTGALVRIDPVQYFTEIGPTQGLIFRNQSQAVGRNIHKSDPLASAWHVIGLFVTLTAAAMTFWGLVRFGFDEPLNHGWLTMRWLTGFVGLFGVAAVMTYPLRKQVYRRRVGALRYWLLVHFYAGAMGGLILTLHAGARTGGLLTTLLYIAFDVVILSGIVGLVSYLIAPRVMTRIEGEPLLYEDLIARRQELLNQQKEIETKSEGWLRDEIRDRVYRRFKTKRFLWRQLVKREDLKALLAEAREEFKERTTRLATDDERELLISAVESAVTQQRVDALLFLHRSMRVWIPVHVISTSLMLAFMLAHIAQAIFFNVRTMH